MSVTDDGLTYQQDSMNEITTARVCACSDLRAHTLTYLARALQAHKSSWGQL